MSSTSHNDAVAAADNSSAGQSSLLTVCYLIKCGNAALWSLFVTHCLRDFLTLTLTFDILIGICSVHKYQWTSVIYFDLLTLLCSLYMKSVCDFIQPHGCNINKIRLIMIVHSIAEEETLVSRWALSSRQCLRDEMWCSQIIQYIHSPAAMWLLGCLDHRHNLHYHVMVARLWTILEHYGDCQFVCGVTVRRWTCDQ